MEYLIKKYKNDGKRRFYFAFDNVLLTDFFATDVENFCFFMKKDLSAALKGSSDILCYNLYSLTFSGSSVTVSNLYADEVGLPFEESSFVMDTKELLRLVRAYCLRRVLFIL